MRRIETSTLAFLDVMACGLGAVILILVVLKQQAPANTAPKAEQAANASETVVELEKLQLELDALLAARNNSQSALERQRKIAIDITASIKKTNQQLMTEASRGSALQNLITNARAALSQQQTPTRPDPIDTMITKRPKYLVGLKVTGSKIVILLDRSASMTARKLVEIMKYKAGSATDRQRAEKWVNAQNAVWWMIARAPIDSRLQVASFSDTTIFHTTNWIKATDSKVLAAVKSKIASLIPQGSTNLEAAVNAAIKSGADNIYIITDGLPTVAPTGRTTLGLDGCGSKWFKREQVTGKCRVSLFSRTVSAAAGNPVRISVVLMPLEGDPDAAPLFSKWALSKGGVMLGAAKDWP